jgi:tRNA(Ile)-lysidine synthase
VVPLLEQINPHLSQSITQHSEYVAAAEYIYKAFIQKKLHRIIQLEQGISKTPIQAFQHQVYGKNLLFEWLNNVGFTSNQIPDIVHAIHTKQSGKIFLSTTHQLSCDRTFMYLIQKEENAFIPLSVEDFTEQELTIQHKKITFSIQQTAAKSFDDTNQTVYLDADKIAVPLLIRTWNQGDYMYPLGMKMKKKKLSDLFSNQKIPNHQKQALLVFESHQKIIFVEGIRIDERFKTTEQTTRFLKISVQNS